MTETEFDRAFSDLDEVARDPLKIRALVAMVKGARADVAALLFAVDGLRHSLALPERLDGH